jgi:hypothetical protein
MKKNGFLMGKKVIIATGEDNSEERVVTFIDTVIEKGTTKFVFENDKGNFESVKLISVKGFYHATPASEKVFNKMKAAYAKIPKIKISFPKVNWKAASFQYATAGSEEKN